MPWKQSLRSGPDRVNTGSSATSCLDEGINVRPTHNITHASVADTPSGGMQMLLDAVVVDGYEAVDKRSDIRNPSLQSLGDQQSDRLLGGGLEG